MVTLLNVRGTVIFAAPQVNAQARQAGYYCFLTPGPVQQVEF